MYNRDLFENYGSSPAVWTTFLQKSFVVNLKNYGSGNIMCDFFAKKYPVALGASLKWNCFVVLFRIGDSFSEQSRLTDDWSWQLRRPQPLQDVLFHKHFLVCRQTWRKRQLKMIMNKWPWVWIPPRVERFAHLPQAVTEYRSQSDDIRLYNYLHRQFCR
jgi:hypothetical protein